MTDPDILYAIASRIKLNGFKALVEPGYARGKAEPRVAIHTNAPAIVIGWICREHGIMLPELPQVQGFSPLIKRRGVIYA